VRTLGYQIANVIVIGVLERPSEVGGEELRTCCRDTDSLSGRDSPIRLCCEVRADRGWRGLVYSSVGNRQLSEDVAQ
jgi:hypothetical protein